MKKQKILYMLTSKDVKNISKQESVPFAEKDLPFIQDRVGNYFENKWQDAIIYALKELKNK